MEADFTAAEDLAERERDGFMSNFQYIADRSPRCGLQPPGLPASRVPRIRDRKKRNTRRSKHNTSRGLCLAGQLRQIAIAVYLELTSIQLHFVVHQILGTQRVTLRC